MSCSLHSFVRFLIDSCIFKKVFDFLQTQNVFYCANSNNEVSVFLKTVVKKLCISTRHLFFNEMRGFVD